MKGHCSIVDNTTIFTVHGASADHLAQQSVVVGYEVDCVVEGAASGDQGAAHCKLTMLLFVDNMEINWGRAQRSQCNKQQHTYLDHEERQWRG